MSTTLTVNIALLDEALAYIETHPEDWDQGNWHCGTSYCFGGHAARIVEGGSLKFYQDDEDTACLEDGRYVNDVAREALGITDKQAEALFNANNDLDALRDVVALIKNGEKFLWLSNECGNVYCKGCDENTGKMQQALAKLPSGAADTN